MQDHFHIGSRKGLFRFEKKKSGWVPSPPAFLGEPVVAVLSDPRDGTIHAALRMGHFGPKMRRSRDGGATWEETPTPKFEGEPERRFPPEAPASNETKGPSVDMVWILAAGGADEPGVLWAGTLPGGLFKSTDGGDSWSLVQSLWNVPQREKWFPGGAADGQGGPGIHSIHVDPRDSRKLTLGISCGGVWKSDDGGASWRQAGHGLRAAFLPPDLQYDPTSQDPHRLSHSGDTVWCQHHNGVFLSRDGGDKFEEIPDIKPSVFGFAAGAHPSDPDTAWLVPGVKDEFRVPVDGKFVVTRTRDGGKSFESLSRGLPEGPAWDLVYRHGFDVDRTGERLVMGSTTGNLWVSENGGEAWSLITPHLPPIAAVAWG